MDDEDDDESGDEELPSLQKLLSPARQARRSDLKVSEPFVLDKPLKITLQFHPAQVQISLQWSSSEDGIPHSGNIEVVSSYLGAKPV